MMDNQKLKSTITDFYKDDLVVASFMNEGSKTVDLILNLAKSRMKTLAEFKNLVIPKAPNLSPQEKNIAKTLFEKFSAISDWNKETILNGMKETLNKHKAKGNVLYEIITGFASGLPLPETLEILGRKAALERIKKLLTKL